MVNFLSNTLSFPTVLYTGLLAIIVLYWLTSMFGFGEFDAIETEIDVDSGDASSLTLWLTKFKLNGIPFTLSVSLIIFFSWLICYFMVELFIKGIDNEWVRVALGFWVILLAPALSIPIVATLLSPLRPLFKKLKDSSKAPSAEDFVGKVATIRSGKVNQSHGSVEVSDGGAGLILQVRADEPNNYQRNDKVILKKYLAASHIYLIRHSTTTT